MRVNRSRTPHGENSLGNPSSLRARRSFSLYSFASEWSVIDPGGITKPDEMQPPWPIGRSFADSSPSQDRPRRGSQPDSPVSMPPQEDYRSSPLSPGPPVQAKLRSLFRLPVA